LDEYPAAEGAHPTSPKRPRGDGASRRWRSGLVWSPTAGPRYLLRCAGVTSRSVCSMTAAATDLLGNPLQDTYRLELMDPDGGNRRELKLPDAEGQPIRLEGVGHPDWH
jgi:hypothetical protein